MTFDHLRLDDSQLLQRIEGALHEDYFAGYDKNFLKTPAGRDDVREHVANRYNFCVQFMLPWLARVSDLRTKTLVEVGCGTGSSTAAFGRVCQRIDGYDIHEASVKAANKRLAVLGLDEARAHLVQPDGLREQLMRRHAAGIDAFLLYAVLEHQTIEERLDTLRLGWELLKEGGLLVVIETPNRLVYRDHHTSCLPFFHMLPPALARRCAHLSPREVFRDAMARIQNSADTEQELALTRWGVGASFHELELAIPEYRSCVELDGLEQEMVDAFPSTPDEDLLRAYFYESGVEVPLGFTRNVLNVTLRKGGARSGLTRPVPPPPKHLEEAAALRKELEQVTREREQVRQEREQIRQEREQITQALEQVTRERDQVSQEFEQVSHEFGRIKASVAVRLHRWLVERPIVGDLAVKGVRMLRRRQSRG